MTEKTEPAFIPGWLKGTVGPPNLQEDSGFSKAKVTPRSVVVGNNSDTAWSLAISDKGFCPPSRKSVLERLVSEKDHLNAQRFQPNLHRTSSARNYDWERDGSAVRNDQEYERDGNDRDRRREKLFSTVIDVKDNDKDHVDQRLSNTGLSLKLDSERILTRSQSQSPRFSDRNIRKISDVVPSSSCITGGLPTTVHKLAFDRNFPSLGSDEKQTSHFLSSLGGNSSIASPRPLISNSRPLWQQSSRPEVNQSLSPGLTGGIPHATVSSSMTVGGIDAWSSVLADVPNSSNGNTSMIVTNSNQTVNFTGPASTTTVTPLNMAEALTQSTPRAKSSPQVSLESQRLEELALKQSRQLIPMTPSLPKTMVLVDKSKSKTSRNTEGAKGNQQLGVSQTNPPHKSATAGARLDASKHAQSKLLVLKSGKDGIIASTTSKADLSSSLPLTPQGGTGLTVSATMMSTSSATAGLRKQDEHRSKGLMVPLEDKRPSLQAQNRSDFFNSIRRKSSNSGNTNHTSICSDQRKVNVSTSPEKSMNKEEDLSTKTVSNFSKVSEDSSNKPEANGLSDHAVQNCMHMENPVEEASCKPVQVTGHSFIPGASEEEETAFLRSLGWEENDEGTELTEEEITAFYHKLKERKTRLNGRCNHPLKTLSVGKFVGSFESLSSGLTSSDSETDDEPSYRMQMALSNTVH